MNVFSGVTSPRVFSYYCILPEGLNSNLTYGLKPQVSNLKTVTVYRRSIFQVKWLIATLIRPMTKVETLVRPTLGRCQTAIRPM